MFSKVLTRLPAFSLLCAVAISFAAPSKLSQAPQPRSGLANSVVLVIRHSEKPETGTGLTPAGEARAKAYVKYFSTYKVAGHPFHPDYIFATADGKKSFRERLTMEPLAAALKIKIDNQYSNKEFKELADAMKSKHVGNNVIICWHHGHIPDLVEALGGDKMKLIPGGKWPAETFDWVIQLAFDGSGNLIPGQTKRIPEKLMPSDAH